MIKAPQIKSDIVLYPNDSLLKKSVFWKFSRDSDQDLIEIISKMHKTMISLSGVGISAPQIGINKNIIVFYNACMVNPIIYHKTDSTDIQSEGCLSLPGRFYDVKRSKGIRVEWVDPFTRELMQQHFSGFTARIIQHEIDHIYGKLINEIHE